MFETSWRLGDCDWRETRREFADADFERNEKADPGPGGGAEFAALVAAGRRQVRRGTPGRRDRGTRMPLALGNADRAGRRLGDPANRRRALGLLPAAGLA